MDNNALTALISGFFGVITLIVSSLLQRRAHRRKEPKNRIEIIFNSYDALIGQLHADLDKKSELITSMQVLLDKQQRHLEVQIEENRKSQRLIAELHDQLEESGKQVLSLKNQLESLRHVA